MTALFAPALALLLGSSLAAEWRRFAGPDIACLLDAAARVLDGGRLYVDVVELNPPLIIALNAAAVWCARVLGLSGILVYRLGFTAALLAVLWLSARLLRDALPDEVAQQRGLVLVLAFVLFPLAGPDYGEREHLILALLVPYALLAAARSLGHQVTNARGLSLGVMAGFAFALKPHFLLLWIMVEVFLRTTRRVSARTLLPETLAIAGILIGYLALIAMLTPEYLAVVELLGGSYTRFLYQPFWRLLVTGPGALLALFALLSFVALYRYARHPALWRATALATGACLIAGAAQQKGLRYHFYPAFGFGTLMLGLIALDSAPVVGSRLRLIYRSLAVGVLAAVSAVAGLEQLTAFTGRAKGPERGQFEQLVELVRARAAGEGVFVMSYHIRSAYPLINYGAARSASRLPHLWILASEYLEALKGEQPVQYRSPAEMSPSERYLNRAVLEDLSRRPKLLLVFRHARDLPVNGYRRLDYVAYFSRDPGIGRILQEYQLITRTGDYLVYEWLPPGAPRAGAPPTSAPGTHDISVIRETGAALRLEDSRALVPILALLGGVAAAVLSAPRSRESAGM